MTILQQNLKAGPDGKLHVGDIDVGVPNAEVQVTLSVQKKLTAEEWKAEMRKLTGSVSEDGLMRYPDAPIRDAWEEA